MSLFPSCYHSILFGILFRRSLDGAITTVLSLSARFFRFRLRVPVNSPSSTAYFPSIPPHLIHASSFCLHRSSPRIPSPSLSSMLPYVPHSFRARPLHLMFYISAEPRPFVTSHFYTIRPWRFSFCLGCFAFLVVSPGVLRRSSQIFMFVFALLFVVHDFFFVVLHFSALWPIQSASALYLL